MNAHLLGEVFLTEEDAMLEQSAVQDREEDLDLVCARHMGRCTPSTTKTSGLT
jgi:hypothetical protein